MTSSALNWVQAVGTVATAVGLAAGAIWAYVKFRKRGEGRPRVVSKTHIQFVGHHGGKWLLILTADVTNTGFVRWEATQYTFELRCAFPDDDLSEADEASEGLKLPRLVLEGSWVDEGFLIWVDPNSAADFKYVVTAPGEASLFQLFSEFHYVGKRPDDAETSTDVVVVMAPTPGPVIGNDP